MVGDRTVDAGLVGALSELAARVQRGRTHDDVLRVAGEGVVRLGMRLLVFQLDGSELVLRYLATVPERHEAVERLVGRPLEGLRAPLEHCGSAADIVAERALVYRNDLDLFIRFVEASTGRSPIPLDASASTSGVSNGVVTPLFVRGEPWGLLSLVSSAFGPEDAAAVALFATHVGSALEVADFVQTLQQTQDELISRERLATIGELAATVAHEVRNPLGVLFNSVASLRRLLPDHVDDSKRPDAEVLLAIVSEETERLNEIVTDLLELARPWAMRTKETALDTIVRTVVSDVPRLPDGSSVDVRLELSTDLPPVDADPRMLRQALLNLVINAIQAMPKGGTLRVETRMEHRDDVSLACIDVSDTGTGIPLDDQERVLEPFYTTKPNGTGLGLALVKRVVEAHQGELEIVSDSGGTTFTMRLPLPKWDDSQVTLRREAAAARPLRAMGTVR
ncbi:MAG: Sensor protein [Labilithrix sp.]|nr:Sensor protein [Labilithrix sp.]